jgi:multicomponent Na+:H+ antiporter subunit F
MNGWLLAAIGLLPAFGLGVFYAGRGGIARRLVAVQLAGSLASLILVALTFAFDQSAFMDLPLTLALLTWPSMLLIAFFLERWL